MIALCAKLRIESDFTLAGVRYLIKFFHGAREAGQLLWPEHADLRSAANRRLFQVVMAPHELPAELLGIGRGSSIGLVYGIYGTGVPRPQARLAAG